MQDKHTSPRIIFKGGNAKVLLGEYHHQIDEKGRIRIPPKLKNQLLNGKTVEEAPPFVTRGVGGKYLMVFSHEMAEKKFVKKFEENDFTDAAEAKKIRYLTSVAMDGSEDKQGRITLTKKLMEYAELKKDIVTIGVYDRIEIWSKENWEEYTKEDDFDKCMADISKKGTDE